MYSNDNNDAMWWGSDRNINTNDRNINKIDKSCIYRARIRIIGSNGSEQQPIYFLLLRTTKESFPYHVNVTKYSDFDFIEEWH